MEFNVISGNPVIAVLTMKIDGQEFEVVDMPASEQKWYFNEDGEYVRYDG